MDRNGMTKRQWTMPACCCLCILLAQHATSTIVDEVPDEPIQEIVPETEDATQALHREIAQLKAQNAELKLKLKQSLGRSELVSRNSRATRVPALRLTTQPPSVPKVDIWHSSILDAQTDRCEGAGAKQQRTRHQSSLKGIAGSQDTQVTWSRESDRLNELES